MKNQTKYWIIVASQDHVKRGIEQGIAQACHGKVSPLRRMQKNDWIIYYSSKEEFGKAEKCQYFTAIGQVKDEITYQVEMSADFKPFRRNICFSEANAVAIAPLINDLDFIQNKKAWGYVFRFGFFEISEKDFNLIAEKMLVSE